MSAASTRLSQPATLVCLFRNDLRLHDNPCLYFAHTQQVRNNAATNATHVVHLHCFDPDGFATTWHFKFPKTGVHRMRFLTDSVRCLSEALASHGSELVITRERPSKALQSIIELCRSGDKPAPVKTLVYQAENTYEELKVEESLDTLAQKSGIQVHKFHGMQLHHPADIPYDGNSVPRSFTQYRRGLEKHGTQVRQLLVTPKQFKPTPRAVREAYRGSSVPSVEELLADNALCVDSKTDYKAVAGSAFPFPGGEQAALQRVQSYVWDTKNVVQYKHTRNGLVGTEYSTKFSAYLANGCLSPRFAYHEMKRCERLEGKRGTGADNGMYWVIFEMMWRDYFRLVCTGAGKKVFLEGGIVNLPREKMSWWPAPNTQPTLQQSFGSSATSSSSSSSSAMQEDIKESPASPHAMTHAQRSSEWFEMWRQGQTGVPFVDANMRELLHTGWMSNRGRQNVASFLVHDLKIDWRRGAEWFESLLLDHDVCSNYANWNSAAGLASTDPRARFRKFNVVKQAVDYDPDAVYIKQWIPELAAVEHPKHAIAPWTMTLPDRRRAHDFKLGVTYPKPVVCPPEWARYTTVPRAQRAPKSGRAPRTGAAARVSAAKKSRTRGIDFYFKS